MDYGVWVSVIATIVAVASAAISIHNSRLSVRPVVGFWVESDGATHRLVLANKGNGPAIIESAIFKAVDFENKYGDVKTNAVAGLFFRFSIESFCHPRYFEIEQALPLASGQMLGAGDELDVCRFTLNAMGEKCFCSWRKERWPKSFHITVELKDMFGERWKVLFKDGQSSFIKNRDMLI